MIFNDHTLAVVIMEFDFYDLLVIADNLSILDFVSVGHRGEIIKRIEFNRTYRPEIFSLSLSDIRKRARDTRSRSNNGDRDKILATVVYAIDIYTQRYPERWIHLAGNTKQKTRLYRMTIGLNLAELSKRFYIYAQINDEIRLFSVNMPVDSFLVKRKIL